MKVTVFLADGGEVFIEDLDSGSALDLMEELRAGTAQFLTLDLDDGDTTLLNRDQITRVDFQ